MRAFVAAGGVERRGKGSHRVIKMPNGRVLSLPAGVVKVGLLRSRIKIAGMTEDEFIAAL